MNGHVASLAVLSAGLLTAMPAFLGGAAANASAPAPIQQESSAQDNRTLVASIGGLDRIASTHVSNLLSLNGIGAFIFGSRGYGVSVENADAERAIRILIDDAKKNPYKLYVGDTSFELAAKITTVQINQKTDENGRIKVSPRNPYIERAVREVYRSLQPKPDEQDFGEPEWDFVKHIKLAKRRYLDAEGHWNVGYDFTVEFGSSESKRAYMRYAGCVWDEGKLCQLSGGGGSYD